ncbi:hypothetical protein [Enterovibrio nigricans]|uniref:Uncharacterized protein n=1 Tax=Enterovibrio nigricans DSM 22720 TaxID=1121868 RepID=A0A1T4W7T1_9GAMM|nr:hypothetical protein [Enterovibrio nigricans]PKF48808.1 hypothetical protein AT251_23430 [Enterovibrio nigricans]SKA73257.1 hypothetical protein SAMN02745132_04810 [Enterovibrio nigricans DSM 22720]
MTNNMIIHQTLHGYLDGHRLISSSTMLSNKAKSIMLKESDSPGEDFHYDNVCCYSGYSIPEDEIYVISKTWVASEISRPGCVWTHSLLLPYSLLEEINPFEFFNPIDLFHDDKSNVLDNFDLVEPISLHGENNTDMNFSRDIAFKFTRVFSTNSKKIALSSYLSIYDILIFIDMLWPKERESFSFKTWTPRHIEKSTNFNRFSLALNNHVEHLDDESDWANPIFLNKESAKHFFFEYGKNTNRSNIKNLSICFSLIESNAINELCHFLLRWKGAPLDLVRNVIYSVSEDSVTTNFASLFCAFLLFIERDHLKDSVSEKVGQLVFTLNSSLFYKVIDTNADLVVDFISGVINSLPHELIIKLYSESKIPTSLLIKSGTQISNLLINAIDNREDIISLANNSKSLENASTLLDMPSIIHDINPKLSIPLIINSNHQKIKLYSDIISSNKHTVLNYIQNHEVNKELSDALFLNIYFPDTLGVNILLIEHLYFNSSKSTEILCKVLDLTKSSEIDTFIDVVIDAYFQIKSRITNDNISFDEKTQLKDATKRNPDVGRFIPVSVTDHLNIFISLYIGNRDDLLERFGINKTEDKKSKKKRSKSRSFFDFKF